MNTVRVVKRLVNIQATALLTHPIPHETAARIGVRRRGRRRRGGERNIFPAYIYKTVIGGDRVSYLLFPNRSRVVISGPDSPETLRKAIDHLLEVLRKHGYEGDVVSYSVHSYNTAFDLKHTVDLECAQRILAEAYPDATIIYEPGSLPHLRMFREGHATLLLTTRGKGWVIGRMNPEKESEYIDEIASILEACYSS